MHWPNLTIPTAPGLWMMLLASPTLLSFIMVFVLLCLCFCFCNVSPKALWGNNVPASPCRALCPQHSLGTCIFNVESEARGSQSLCPMRHSRPGPSRDIRCQQVAACGAGSSRPLGAAHHRDTIPPPNVPPWLCYSQLNDGIMTSLLSPNSPNYSLEIYYLIW